MEVVTLGTGNPLPDPNRAGPATLVRAAGLNLLVDCGRGVLMRLAAAGLPSPLALHAVLLTHLHSDHITDFNDVLTMSWAMAPAPTPLRVFGPPGTRRFVDSTLAMLEDDIGWRIAHHDDLNDRPECEVTEVEAGPVFETGGVRVLADETDHRPVRPTVGYRVESNDGSAVVAGDSVPCPGLDRLCANADIYVQTVIRRSLIEALPIPRIKDVLDYHSTTEDAGRTAAKGGVGTLVMTHPFPPPAPGTEDDWVAEARLHFDGSVILADDLTSVSA